MRCRRRDGPCGSHHVDARALKCEISFWSTDEDSVDVRCAVAENEREARMDREDFPQPSDGLTLFNRAVWTGNNVCRRRRTAADDGTCVRMFKSTPARKTSVLWEQIFERVAVVGW